MNVVTIIQARTASTRLPGKVFREICGEKVLDIVISKCRQFKGASGPIVATSDNPDDRVIMDHVGSIGIQGYAGSESDVLERYYRAALEVGADAVVRITADCPMLDPQVSSTVVAKFLESGWDYVSNIKPPTFPDGLDTEVFSLQALKRAFDEAILPLEREHVTPYIWRNPDIFRLGNVEYIHDLSHLRWTLDNEDDLKMMTALCRRLPVGFGEATFGDFLEAWNDNPSVQEINSQSMRNESLEAQLEHEVGTRHEQ